MLTIERYWVPTDIDLSLVDSVLFYRDDHLDYDECKEFLKICIDVVKSGLVFITIIYDTQFIDPRYYSTVHCKSDELESIIENILSFRQTNMCLQPVDNTITNGGQVFGHYSKEMLVHAFQDDTYVAPDMQLINMFDIINSMPTVALDFNKIYSWFTTYLSTLPRSGSVGYYYVYNDPVNKKYVVSPRQACVTGKIQSIGKNYNLSKWFDGGTDMYLQCTPRDIYFVVPKQIQGQTFGDHYRFHNIAQYSPDYDRSKNFNNVIDIHRTNNYYDRTRASYYTNHDPKCVFHNGSIAPIIDNDINLDQISCFNKRQSGYHYMGRVFSDQQEYRLVSELIKMPFQDELSKKRAAADVIKRAFKKKLSQKAGSRKKHLEIGYDATVDYMHILYTRQRPDWHITVTAYDSAGEPIKDVHFVINRLTLKNIEVKLKELRF